MNKKLTILIVAGLVAVSATSVFAQGTKVKSKRGDINLMSASGGSDVVCEAGFNDELTILKNDGSNTLVKAPCGQGWVANADIERVQKGPGDKTMNIEQVDVTGWMDNPSAMFVLDQGAAQFDGVNINRDFKDYLNNTLDREQTEMRNQEN
jgi:hypothetical protein